MSQKNNNVAFWGGILIGSAMGTMIGLLLAPRKGKETREILQKTAEALPEMAEDLSTTFQLHSHRMAILTKRNWEQTVAKFKKAIAIGIEASREVNNHNNQ
jgi:gas vesicle protein